MPRRTHKAPEEVVEDIRFRMIIKIPLEMRQFLEIEAKRITESRSKEERARKKGNKLRSVTPADIIRALVTAYYEKRVLCDLLVSPDD